MYVHDEHHNTVQCGAHLWHVAQATHALSCDIVTTVTTSLGDVTVSQCLPRRYNHVTVSKCPPRSYMKHMCYVCNIVTMSLFHSAYQERVTYSTVRQSAFPRKALADSGWCWRPLACCAEGNMCSDTSHLRQGEKKGNEANPCMLLYLRHKQLHDSNTPREVYLESHIVL